MSHFALFSLTGVLKGVQRKLLKASLALTLTVSPFCTVLGVRFLVVVLKVWVLVCCQHLGVR